MFPPENLFIGAHDYLTEVSVSYVQKSEQADYYSKKCVHRKIKKTHYCEVNTFIVRKSDTNSEIQ